MSPEQALAQAFDQITTWMRAHRAAKLSENLAAGASDERLDAVESALGFPLGPELRALWSLHDGQQHEQNGFVENLDLLSTELALAVRPRLLLAVGFLRDTPDAVPKSGLTEAELRSNAWVPIAQRDHDGLAVNTVSGRVFKVSKDSPPLVLVAPSLIAWATGYAARVAADDYRVQEGFGDYYLSLRDRSGERLRAEGRQHEREERERKKRMPLAQLLDEAIAKNDESAAQELVGRALRKGGAVSAEVLTRLFAGDVSPRFHRRYAADVARRPDALRSPVAARLRRRRCHRQQCHPGHRPRPQQDRGSGLSPPPRDVRLRESREERGPRPEDRASSHHAGSTRLRYASSVRFHAGRSRQRVRYARTCAYGFNSA